LRKQGGHKIFINEAALTVEAGSTRDFDRIVVTHCGAEIQIKRLMERDQIPRTEAARRLESQMDSAEKLKYADYTIDTSGSLRSVIEQTERVYRHLLQDYNLLYGEPGGSNKQPR